MDPKPGKSHNYSNIPHIGWMEKEQDHSLTGFFEPDFRILDAIFPTIIFPIWIVSHAGWKCDLLNSFP